MAPGIDAHVHQHVFSFRFDMAVDGERNSVSEVNFSSLPLGPDNRHGNAIAITETKLATESEAQRVIDLAASRYWRVTNPQVLNALGDPVGYKLVPGANALPFLNPDSPGRPARRLHVQAFLGDAVRRRRVLPRRPISQTSIRAATACRAGPRPTAPSTMSASSFGTRSTITICRALRTGRCSPASTRDSTGCHRDFSTPIRPSTCRRPRPSAVDDNPLARSMQSLMVARELIVGHCLRDNQRRLQRQF